jgi:predicted amidophosphoribosyltransferase
LTGAFQAVAEVQRRDVLLIDDVVTTGHTARECAKALREAGARSVGILAFAGNLD